VAVAAEQAGQTWRGPEQPFGFGLVALPAGEQEAVGAGGVIAGAVPGQQFCDVGPALPDGYPVRGVPVLGGGVRVAAGGQEQPDQFGRATGLRCGSDWGYGRLSGYSLAEKITGQRPAGVGPCLQQQPDRLGVAGADRGGKRGGVLHVVRVVEQPQALMVVAGSRAVPLAVAAA